MKSKRAKEAPFRSEAAIDPQIPLSGERLAALGGGMAAAMEALKVHAASGYVLGERYINPESWTPLIFSARR